MTDAIVELQNDARMAALEKCLATQSERVEALHACVNQNAMQSAADHDRIDRIDGALTTIGNAARGYLAEQERARAQVAQDVNFIVGVGVAVLAAYCIYRGVRALMPYLDLLNAAAQAGA